MSTIRQKKLAKAIVENIARKKPKNKTELLESSGYTPVSARASAKMIISQKGVQEELVILGFDEDSAKQVVSEIMSDRNVDPQARLKATDQIFKVKGSYAPDRLAVADVTPLTDEERIRLEKILLG